MRADAAESKPIERNQSIVWARYQIDAKDWVTLATRSTTLDEVEVFSAAVLSADGQKILFEGLVKPDGEVSSEIFAMHGVTSKVIFNALEPQDLLRNLLNCLQNKKVLCWDLEACLLSLNSLSRRAGGSDLPIFGETVKTYYRKFSGSDKLPHTGSPSPTEECQALIGAVTQMAASSQTHDSEDLGRQGWTAEFYKPSKTPAQKFKDILGL